MLRKKEPALEDLENCKPIHIAKNKKVCSRKNIKGVAGPSFTKRGLWIDQPAWFCQLGLKQKEAGQNERQLRQLRGCQGCPYEPRGFRPWGRGCLMQGSLPKATDVGLPLCLALRTEHQAKEYSSLALKSNKISLARDFSPPWD